jgi:hypothetical protein
MQQRLAIRSQEVYGFPGLRSETWGTRHLRWGQSLAIRSQKVCGFPGPKIRTWGTWQTSRPGGRPTITSIARL